VTPRRCTAFACRCRHARVPAAARPEAAGADVPGVSGRQPQPL
jgi:hypothetical protein